MKTSLLILADIDQPSQRRLDDYFEVIRHSNWRESTDPGKLSAALARENPGALILESQPLSAAAIAAAPNLGLIASVRATPANVDTAYCESHGIVVTNAPGRNAVAVVEMTMAFILDIARSIPLAYHHLRERRMTLRPGTPPRDSAKDVIWSHPALEQSPYIRYKGVEVAGKTLGLIGFGAIGRMVVPRAKAFGMRVLVHDPYVNREEIRSLGVEDSGLDEVLAQADFVSLHAKVTAETTRLIGREQLRRMKPSAYLVNTARGALVDQDALVLALREGVIAGAALDVFESEPLHDDSPLLDMDNVIVTPHIGGATRDVLHHQSRIVTENAIAYAEKRTPPNRYV